MNLDTWDQLDRPRARELAVGRRLDNGAPDRHARDRPVDITAIRDGIPVIPPNALWALAHPHQPAERFLRRPYNRRAAGRGRPRNPG